MKKNTGKAPAEQFYYKDFLADMAEHDPDIIGAWMLVLIKIWHLNNSGSVTKTLSQFAKIMHTDEIGAKRFIDYLGAEKIADVTEDNGRITIVNRRAKRDCKLREANRLRQETFRRNAKSNADVADEKVNPSSSTSFSNSNSSLDISTKRRSTLDLEQQKKAIQLTEKLERVFEYQNTRERTTFRNIVRHLLDCGMIESGMVWLKEVLRWGSDNDKSQLDMKKCFNSKVQKLAGFKKKAE